MSAIDSLPALQPSTARRWLPTLSTQSISMATTILVWVAMMTFASLYFRNFFSANTFINLFGENAFLGITAIGMTFVILSGGIDLSVGANIGFTSVLVAKLIATYHWPPLAAMAFALITGILFGGFMGMLIAFIDLPAFLVTLAGMFFARGMAFVLSMDQIAISDPFYDALDKFRSNYFPVTAIVFAVMLAIGAFIARQTRFGRAVYAIGGNENSAILMGVRVRWSKVSIYALSGFFSALAGIVFTLNLPSGNANNAQGLELDAIAAVVIGGTPLSGGVGGVFGALMGVMILGTISVMIIFANLNSAWGKIATGVLLLAFILLQQFIERQVSRRSQSKV